MPTIIVKPERETDFYVAWSSMVEAPTCWGPREYVAREMACWDGPEAAAPERFDRADQTGTSARYPSGDAPEGGWDDRGFIYQQQGWLPRARLTALCERLGADERADVSDLLDPFED